MERNSCTSTTAVRTFRGAAGPTCDNVRVNISTPAPGRDDVILICDSDSQHMASAKHTYSLACFIQPAPLGYSSGLLPSQCVNQSPVSSPLPQAEDRPRTPLRLRVTSAELSSSGKRGQGALCFQQQGFPTPLFFQPRPTHR